MEIKREVADKKMVKNVGFENPEIRASDGDRGQRIFQERIITYKTLLRNVNFQPPNLPFPLGVLKQLELGVKRPSLFYRRVFTHRISILPCDQVHESSREPAILTGYRPDRCSLSESVASLFCPTNETLNFWSHFIAAAYFIWRFLLLTDIYDFRTDVYVWPLIPYFFTAFLYPFMSSVAHAFSCIGFTVRHICFFLDYGAISIYSFGCAVLYRAYIFPSELFDTDFEKVFLSVCVFNSITATVLTCLSRFIPDDKRVLQKVVRLGWFVISYCWESFPLLMRIVNCPLQQGSVKSVNGTAHFSSLAETAPENSSLDEYVCDRLAIYHYLQMAAIGIAALCYATHIPEKFFPGRFDFFGNSHHFLHIFGVLATYFQMEGALIDVEHRRGYLDANNQVLDEFSSLLMPLTVIGLNFVILFVFSYYVVWKYSDEVTLTRKRK